LELGRNDICYCGSNKKYKNCHLKPFYPIEYFDCQIREFENIKFENRASPHIKISRVDVTYRDPYPWDKEIVELLQEFRKVKWDEDRWQNRIKKRIDRVHHKLDALKYHISMFKGVEENTESGWKNYIVANTTVNKIYEDPNLIHNVEAFLFQSKSCLDVFAQIIAYSFKFDISSYEHYGDGLIKILQKQFLKQNSTNVSNMIDQINKNRSWIKELVEMRDEVTHYSDLEGLSCFLITMSKDTDKSIRVYYPAMPSGERVSKYMERTWFNIKNLIENCSQIIIKNIK
jgi:hypothetical protein